MKKLFLSLFIAMALSASALAALVDFTVNIGGAPSVTAGSVLEITITAWDYDMTGDGVFNDTSYAGKVSVTASVPGSVVLNTGNDLTGNFTSGQWTGTIALNGAGAPLVVTVTDASGSTGIASKTVTPGAFAGVKIMAPGMIYAPGTASGYTGSPENQIPAQPFSVTAYAVDAHNNLIGSGYPNVRVRPSGVASYTVAPSGFVDLSTSSPQGMQVYDVMLNPPDSQLPNTYPLNAEASTGELDTANIPMISLNDYFIWAAAPGSVTAGEPFGVTVYVAHELNGTPVFGFNEIVQIEALTAPGGLIASPGLLPVATPVAAMSNGVAYFTVSYTKSGAIMIEPQALGSTAMENAALPSRFSQAILIKPDVPQSFTSGFYGDNVLERGKSVTITAMMFDQYYNVVTGAAANFEITSIDGALNTGTAYSASHYITELYNRAFAVFTAPSANKANIIQVSVPGIIYPQNVTITSILTEKFENWPNPFRAGSESVKINYYLAEDSKIKLEIFSSFGKLVWSKEIEPGTSTSLENHSVRGGNTYTWDGRATDGYTIGVGVYVLRITVEDSSGKRVQTRKMAVIK